MNSEDGEGDAQSPEDCEDQGHEGLPRCLGFLTRTGIKRDNVPRILC